MSTVTLFGLDGIGVNYESGLDGTPRRRRQLTEEEAAERDKMMAAMSEVVEAPRRVLIVEGNDTRSRIDHLLRDEVRGQGFEVISFDEAGGTCAAEPDSMTDADRDRSIWNDAVDQRKYERQQRRLGVKP